MGDVLLRASPDEEIYVIWSTYADDATWIIDTRGEVLELLLAAVANENPFLTRLFAYETPEAVLQRVDETGTASRTGAFGYKHERLRVGRSGLGANDDQDDCEWWYLPRIRLTEYAKALFNEDEAGAKQWLVPEKLEL